MTMNGCHLYQEPAGFGVWGVRCSVWDSGFGISNLGVSALGVGLWDAGSRIEVSRFGENRLGGLGARDSDFIKQMFRFGGKRAG